MTRAILGVLVLNALYAGLGAAVLRASGFRVAGRIGAVGLSLALGWTAFAVVASVAIIAGLSLGVPQIVALVAATAVAALLAAKRWPAPEEPAMPALETAGWHRFVGDGTATVLGVYLGLLVARSLFAVADRHWDSWAFWLPKAKSIHFFGGLETTAGGFTSFASQEYPPAAPALDAATYAFAGGVEAWPIGLQHALAGAAFFVAAGTLLGRRVPGWILWPSLLALALAPDLALAFDAALADLTVAYLVGLGGVTGALWLLEGSRPPLVLCGLFLAAASLTKSEGFAFSLALVAALTAASLFEPRRRLPLVGLAAVPLLALLLWKLWLSAHDQPLESVLFNTSDLVRPRFLFDRLDRLEYAGRELAGLLVDPGRWLLVVPLALAAGIATLVRHTALGVLYLGWLGLSFLALVSVYWISNADVVWHVGTSAARVTASLVVFASVLFPLLLAELERAPDSAAQSTEGG